MQEVEIPVKQPRRFLPEDLKIDSWAAVEPFFKELKERPINSKKDLENWLLDTSELDSVFSEDLAWRYIRMTCHTDNKEYTDAYQFFVTEIEPNSAPYYNEFNKKMIESPYTKDLDQKKFFIFLRAVKKALEIYREENIPVFTEIQTESQKYQALMGSLTIEHDGKEITMQRAASYLKEPNRQLREEVYYKMKARRAKEEQTLNDLFTKLTALRDKVAKNAGYKNYRDYKFDELGRFDYTIQDCYAFHESISKEIVPINNIFDEERRKALGVDTLKPWDTEVDVTGKPSLKPFASGEELIEKTIVCFNKIRPFYGECLAIMKEMGHLDLESRIGKAPGGYNYPLHETGVPFIFMNSVGSHRDLVTMVHEGGHAIHSFYDRELELTDFKRTPSEVAELASMSMELISMEHWDVFFSNEEDLKRAKREQLEKVLKTLPWIGAVDKFQHWIYENPTHTVAQREEAWTRIIKEFSSSVVDWSGNEDSVKRMWQGQLHIFEIPFYYIEYGMAQLGAIAVWRNYKRDPQKALDGYEAALKLGYTKSIPEIYAAAGIKFDFSKEYVKELADFVRSELSTI
jgi:oligoendopeptidase F